MEAQAYWYMWDNRWFWSLPYPNMANRVWFVLLTTQVFMVKLTILRKESFWDVSKRPKDLTLRELLSVEDELFPKAYVMLVLLSILNTMLLFRTHKKLDE